MERISKNSGLHWRIVTALLFASLLPLGLTGFGFWTVFSRLLENKALELHRNIVETHAQSIDLFLAERLRVLNLMARSYDRDALTNHNTLTQLLSNINESYGMSFADLGVIDSDGTHLAYVGPYDLHDKIYAREPWFLAVMSRGIYISDVFLGFRNVPHFIIAVKHVERGEPWILRATINSVEFDKLVRSGRIGNTGDTFIINKDGLYQTPARSGHVMDQSPIGGLQMQVSVQHSRVNENGHSLLRAAARLQSTDWIFVVQQDASEIYAPVRRAMFTGIPVLLTAVLLVAGATILATRHLSRQITYANAQREKLSNELAKSARLASLGEIASGLAHEINNPLSIIGAVHTNMADTVCDLEIDAPSQCELLKAIETCKRQVARCGEITGKMLQFGRTNKAESQPIDIVQKVEETVAFMRQQVQNRRIDLVVSVDRRVPIPPVMVNPSELEQVLVNLINNSFFAIKDGGRIDVSVHAGDKDVTMSVSDDGVGIGSRDLEKIFQPFFTTKPPGEGTGLGLSVCYGIVRDWGGTIEARSTLGEGTTIHVRIPAYKERDAGFEHARLN